MRSTQLTTHAEFLDIDLEKFPNIHNRELKRKQLRYKLVKKEIELTQQKCAGSLTEKEYATLQAQAIDAFDNLLHSDLIADNPDYSPYSVGLTELDIRSLHHRAAISATQSLHQSVFQIAVKEKGIEPGFKAVALEDLALLIFNDYPNQTARLNYIMEHQGDVAALQEKMSKRSLLHQVKLDYEKISPSCMVTPDPKGIERTGTYQDLKKKYGTLAGGVYKKGCTLGKTRSSNVVNKECVTEALAMDLAALYGMKVVKQVIYRGEYDTGAFAGDDHETRPLKLMLKSEYLNGAEELGPLTGGTNKKHGNYRAKAVIMPSNNIRYLSDFIKQLGQHLILLLLQNDRDAIGSQGQNKLVYEDEVVGIDFGKAYQGESLVPQILADFHINLLSHSNYSAFYDVERSEIIRGLLRLARLHGFNLDATILKSYGKEFYNEIQALEPQADEKLIDDYIKKFTEIGKEYTGKDTISQYNKKGCSDIVDELKKIKTKVISARKELLEKFESYLRIEKKSVDLLANIEKRLAASENKTSLRSENQEVLLNHLRITSPTICQWGVKIGYQQRHSFTATFNTVKEAENAATHLKNWLTGYPAEIVKEGKQITINCEKRNLEKIYPLFNEDKLKQQHHPEDYALYLQYKQETKLTKTLNSLSPFFTATLTTHSNGKDYLIEITPQEDLNPVVVQLLREKMPMEKNDDKLLITVPTLSLSGVNAILADIPSAFENIKKQLQLLDENKAIFKAGLTQEKETFIFKMNNDCDGILNRIVKETLSSQTHFSHHELAGLNDKLKQAHQRYLKERAIVESEISKIKNLQEDIFKIAPTQEFSFTLEQAGAEFLICPTQTQSIFCEQFLCHTFSRGPIDGFLIAHNQLHRLSEHLSKILTECQERQIELERERIRLLEKQALEEKRRKEEEEENQRLALEKERYEKEIALALQLEKEKQEKEKMRQLEEEEEKVRPAKLIQKSEQTLRDHLTKLKGYLTRENTSYGQQARNYYNSLWADTAITTGISLAKFLDDPSPLTNEKIVDLLSVLNTRKKHIENNNTYANELISLKACITEANHLQQLLASAHPMSKTVTPG